MASAGLSRSEKMFKKSFRGHDKDDSDELDVFQAARYFSGYNEAVGFPGASLITQKLVKEERISGCRAGRISLDMPIRDLLPEHDHDHDRDDHLMENPMKEKKHKQPSSPGGRLASFLNSLFSQTTSKKKKSKSSTQSMKDEDESPGGRRRRRSSISHHYSNSCNDKRSIYNSSSNSGSRTPPPYAHTPAKSYKEFRSLSDHIMKPAPVLSSLPKGSSNGQIKSTASQNEVWNDKKQKIGNGLSDKLLTSLGGEINQASDYKDRVSQEIQYSSEEKGVRKLDEIDEGAESDSSSDLFELQIYDSGYYPSGLPVYETTDIDRIKR